MLTLGRRTDRCFGPAELRVLGAVAGLYGCGVLAVAGLLESPPWVASASAGALLSALLVAGLVMRAKGRMRRLLQDVPVRVILNDRTALLGAARCASLGL